MPEIVLDNVSKKFGETVAADGLSLRIEADSAKTLIFFGVRGIK